MDQQNFDPIVSQLEEENSELKNLCNSFIAQNDNLYSQIELQYKFIEKQNQELNSMNQAYEYLQNYSDALIGHYKGKAENMEYEVKKIFEMMDQYISTFESKHKQF